MKIVIYNDNKECTAQLKVTYVEEPPKLYQVVMHNDDFTPMEFVVHTLERFFNMTKAKAAEVMFEAHRQGKVACGRYTRDVAESKVGQVIDYATSHEHPLICSMEAV